VDREAELEALRTQVANQAASLAEAVTDGFDGFSMGAGAYGVDLSVPEGPSTGGGVQARQHLRLVPRRKGYPIIVAGTVDPVTSTSEIRTFEHVAILHELRFDSPVEITADEYGEFLRKAAVVMNLARVRSREIGPSPELVAQRAARKKLSIPVLMVFILVLVSAAVVVFIAATNGRK
jgi:hypothetical protein